METETQSSGLDTRAPNIFPALRFADPDAAVDWLGRAFGFATGGVYRNDEGVVHHAEMSLGRGTIMFGAGDPATITIYVAVEDADAHYARAREAGAEIIREVGDTPYESREYSARDLEGHVWTFGTYLPEPAA
jgi:uncharacterized glyoxalase superfamily protein PhnB